MVDVDLKDPASPAPPVDQTPLFDTQAPAEKADASKLSILGDSEVSQAQSGADAQATLQDLRRQVNLLKESAESRGQENTELKDRIASLESMIKKQEDIITLQNQQLAQLQDTLSADNTTATASPSEPVAEEPSSAQPENTFAETQVGQQRQPTMQESAVQPSLMASAATVLQEQGRNMLYAGAVLLLALFAWIAIRRQQSVRPMSATAPRGPAASAFEPARAPDEEAATPAADSVDQQADQAFDEDLQAMDTETAASFEAQEPEQNYPEDTADTETAAPHETAEPGKNYGDDILDEADVYISYGLYQQAEELLKDGLGKQPANQRYQLKLAEIYHGDKRSDEFVRQAEAIAENIDKNSAEWSGIVSMGAALVPGHALFADAASSDDAVRPAAPDDSSADEFDFDIEPDEPAENASESEGSATDSSVDDRQETSQFDFATDIEDIDAKEQVSDAAEQTSADSEQQLEEFSTVELDLSNLDMAKDQTQADVADDILADMPDSSGAESASDEEKDEDQIFLDIDQDALESELNTSISHDSPTEILVQPGAAENVDLDDAADIENAESQSQAGHADPLADEFEDDDSETAIFDSSLLDIDRDADQERDTGQEYTEEDTVSFEHGQVQENLAAELETSTFDSEDLDHDKIEEDALPTLQTEELSKPPGLDTIDDLDENLVASETGTLEDGVLTDDSDTEQFDVGSIDSSMADLGEFGDDADSATPPVDEDVDTKLDLAKAFVDMGDKDAAKETLTEVIEQGDVKQIQEAKELLDKLD